MESDAELLRDLRGFGGWYTHYPDVDSLAERALERGVLRWAYDAAMYAMGTGWSGSSSSSGTFVVAGPGGLVQDNQAFLLVFRGELLKALSG